MNLKIRATVSRYTPLSSFDILRKGANGCSVNWTVTDGVTGWVEGSSS